MVVPGFTEDALGRVIRVADIAPVASAADTVSVGIQVIPAHADSANLAVLLDPISAVFGHQFEVGHASVPRFGQGVSVVAIAAFAFLDVGLASGQGRHRVLASVVDQDLLVSAFEALVGRSGELGLHASREFGILADLLAVVVVLEHLVARALVAILGVGPSGTTGFDLFDAGVLDHQVGRVAHFADSVSTVIGTVIDNCFGFLAVVVVNVEAEFALDAGVLVLILDALEET